LRSEGRRREEKEEKKRSREKPRGLKNFLVNFLGQQPAAGGREKKKKILGMGDFLG